MPPNATGLRVLLGGDQLRQVDLDSGARDGRAGRRPEEWTIGHPAAGTSPTYAILSGCDPLTNLGWSGCGASAPGGRADDRVAAQRDLGDRAGLGRARRRERHSRHTALAGTMPTRCRRLVVLLRWASSGLATWAKQLHVGPSPARICQPSKCVICGMATTRRRASGRGQVIAVTRNRVLWLPPLCWRACDFCTAGPSSHLRRPGRPRSVPSRRPVAVPTARGRQPDGQRVAFTLQRAARIADIRPTRRSTEIAVLALSSGSNHHRSGCRVADRARPRNGLLGPWLADPRVEQRPDYSAC